VTALTGLGLKPVLDPWWTDPATALVVVPIIATERLAGVHGETCEDDCC